MSGSQVLITTTLSSEESTIVIRDAITNNIIRTYKTPDKTIVSPKCLQIISDLYMICTYSGTCILNVWSLAKNNELHRRIILPKANASCLIVSSDSNFLVAGIESSIYSWDLKTGRLLNVLGSHYSTVTNLALTNDSSRLISAGMDALIQIWDFGSMLVPADSFSVVNGVSSRYQPLKSISLPYGQINDLYMTPGSSATDGQFCVAFSKGHVIIYSIIGQHIANVVFTGDRNIARSVVMDRSQTRLFVGLESGNICETRLSTWNRDSRAKIAPKIVELNIEERTKKDSNNHDDNVHDDDDDDDDDDDVSRMKNILKGHTAAVTCLAVRWDGHALISGGMDKKIMIWEVRSHQCIQTINHQGPISNIILTGFLSGLSVLNSLDSQLNLELAASNVSTDISLVTNHGEKRNKNSGNARINTESQGQLMVLPKNPPPTIAKELARNYDLENPFKFDAKQYSTTDHGRLNPFDYGVMIIENGCEDFRVPLDDLKSTLVGAINGTLSQQNNADKDYNNRDEQLSEFKRRKTATKDENDAIMLAAKELISADSVMDHEFINNILKSFDY